MDDLCNKYKPLYLSELEEEYPKIEEYIKANKTFIINGPPYSGKSTIVKLYLEKLNYDYLLIDDFNLLKESILEKIKYRTNSVLSYFYNKNFIIVVDNFEKFNTVVKEFIINTYKESPYIIITNTFLPKEIKNVKINAYNNDYISNLYCIIYFLEKHKNPKNIPKYDNINQMFTILEFNLYSEENKENEENEENEENNYAIFFDKFEYNFNDLVKEKNFIKKLYILDKMDSYNVYHNNLVYNYKTIEDLADSYNYLSDSLYFCNNHNSKNSSSSDYYSILSLIGTSYKLDKFEIKKENFQFKKKLNKNVIYL